MKSIKIESETVNLTTKNEDLILEINDVSIKKWHIIFDGIRICESKFKDISYLYKLLKKVELCNELCWGNISKFILKTLNDKSERTVILHKKIENYWIQYELFNEYDSVSYTTTKIMSSGLDNSKNEEEGNNFYKLDTRLYWLLHRDYKIRRIFYEALKRCLPAPTKNQIFTYKFGSDNFVFFTDYLRPNSYRWKMFKDVQTLVFKEIFVDS
jgi:hypothetical protein